MLYQRKQSPTRLKEREQKSHCSSWLFSHNRNGKLLASGSQDHRIRHITAYQWESFYVFKFTCRFAKVKPSVRPFTSVCGMAAVALLERQGQQSLMAATWAVPHAHCSLWPTRASCVRAHHPRAHRAADLLSPEGGEVHWANRQLQPPKYFPFCRITIPFWLNFKHQLENPAPVKSTRALNKPGRWRYRAQSYNVSPVNLEKF